jgi:hypothetical protein
LPAERADRGGRPAAGRGWAAFVKACEQEPTHEISKRTMEFFFDENKEQSCDSGLGSPTSICSDVTRIDAFKAIRSDEAKIDAIKAKNAQHDKEKKERAKKFLDSEVRRLLWERMHVAEVRAAETRRQADAQLEAAKLEAAKQLETVEAAAMKETVEAQERLKALTAQLEGVKKLNGTKLYHQTSASRADAILRTQRMNPGTNGLAGAGIYFATTPDLTGHKAREKGVILEATVSLGRIHTLERDGDHTMSHARLLSMGFDSVCIARGVASGQEYVVYDPAQVLEIRRSELR